MDGLFTIILFIGISILLSGGKKKKKQEQAAQKQKSVRTVSFADAAEADARAKAAREKPAQPNAAAVAAARAKVLEQLRRQEKPLPPKPQVQPKAPQQSGSLAFDGLEGEAPEEHDEHTRRILETEQRRYAAFEEARDIYDMNLKQLREAIVVSEILDKPVSLRRNGFRRC